MHFTCLNSISYVLILHYLSVNYTRAVWKLFRHLPLFPCKNDKPLKLYQKINQDTGSMALIDRFWLAYVQ